MKRRCRHVHMPLLLLTCSTFPFTFTHIRVYTIVAIDFFSSTFHAFFSIFLLNYYFLIFFLSCHATRTMQAIVRERCLWGVGDSSHTVDANATSVRTLPLVAFVSTGWHRQSRDRYRDWPTYSEFVGCRIENALEWYVGNPIVQRDVLEHVQRFLPDLRNVREEMHNGAWNRRWTILRRVLPGTLKDVLAFEMRIVRPAIELEYLCRSLSLRQSFRKWKRGSKNEKKIARVHLEAINGRRIPF